MPCLSFPLWWRPGLILFMKGPSEYFQKRATAEPTRTERRLAVNLAGIVAPTLLSFVTRLIAGTCCHLSCVAVCFKSNAKHNMLYHSLELLALRRAGTDVCSKDHLNKFSLYIRNENN